MEKGFYLYVWQWEPVCMAMGVKLCVWQLYAWQWEVTSMYHNKNLYLGMAIVCMAMRIHLYMTMGIWMYGNGSLPGCMAIV